MARPVDFSWLEHIVTDVVNVLRHDQSERKLYRYVTSERTEISLSCRELAESNCFSLPIIERLQECDLLDEPCALRLKLAIQEAVMNGFEHGNLELLSAWKEEIQDDGRDKFSIVRRQRLDDSRYGERRVRVVSWFHEGVLEITVCDDGAGFLSRDGEIAVGTSCPTDLSCSGRGLALMSSAVDIVRFTRRGAEVTLIKKLMKHEDS
jgi:anti-sigma regulatory factor (Ser/Thr protein kinase)